MSFAFAEQLNNTLDSLKAQAASPVQMKALLMWYAQSDNHAETLLAVLEEDVSARFPMTQSLMQESLQMDAEQCYQALVHLTPCDMARFSITHEFGPSFKNKPFYYQLVQSVASRIANTVS